jgi:hypothetical protein
MPPPPPEGSQWPSKWTLQYGNQTPRQPTFRQLLAEAVRELSDEGYTSAERIAEWMTRLRNAAERELGPDAAIDVESREALGAIFQRWVDRNKIAERVEGVTRFGIGIVKPQLRAELDRRILASADLIKLHRREAVERSLQRFRGWSTSIPPGGDGTIDKRETRTAIGKSVAQFQYESRRVQVDQSHKLVANVSEIVAVDGGAIAAVWHSHGEHDKSYNARKEHLARAGRVYLVRDSWAQKEGLVKLAGSQYTDEIDKPASAVFCRCYFTWITSPRRLPEELLTKRGHEWIARGRMAA